MILRPRHTRASRVIFDILSFNLHSKHISLHCFTANANKIGHNISTLLNEIYLLSPSAYSILLSKIKYVCTCICIFTTGKGQLVHFDPILCIKLVHSVPMSDFNVVQALGDLCRKTLRLQLPSVRVSIYISNYNQFSIILSIL